MKVSKKKILTALDTCGVSKDCRDVVKVLDELFPGEKEKQPWIDPRRISFAVQPSDDGYFDIAVRVDDVKIGSLSGGYFASNVLSTRYSSERRAEHSHGGYTRILDNQ